MIDLARTRFLAALAPGPAQALRRGLAMVLASAFFFAATAAMVRHVSGQLPVEDIVFWRNLFSLLILAPLLLKRRVGLLTPNWRLLLLRSLAALASLYCYFIAVSEIALGEAILLQFTGPVFTPFLAAFFFGYAIDRRTLMAVALGLAGVLLVVRPGFAELSLGTLIGLASGFLSGLSLATVWRLSAAESTLRLVFAFTALGVVVAFPLALANWQAPSITDLLWLLAIAGTSTLAHLLMMRGCALAPADRAAAASYSAVIFGAIFAWALWGEEIALISFLGMGFIACAAILAGRPLVAPVKA